MYFTYFMHTTYFKKKERKEEIDSSEKYTLRELKNNNSVAYSLQKKGKTRITDQYIWPQA